MLVTAVVILSVIVGGALFVGLGFLVFSPATSYGKNPFRWICLDPFHTSLGHRREAGQLLQTSSSISTFSNSPSRWFSNRRQDGNMGGPRFSAFRETRSCHA